MTPYYAQRIRFGILAARHHLERSRLTPEQIDYLEGCESEGWGVRDSKRAFRREFNAAYPRYLAAEWQEAKTGNIGELWAKRNAERREKSYGVI